MLLQLLHLSVVHLGLSSRDVSVKRKVFGVTGTMPNQTQLAT